VLDLSRDSFLLVSDANLSSAFFSRRAGCQRIAINLNG
jgi:hypothetical protein